MSTTTRDPIEGALDEVERYRLAKQRAVDELALRIVERRDEGETVRALAERYSVPPSSVHHWTTLGRELREHGRRPLSMTWAAQAERTRRDARYAIAALVVALVSLIVVLACVALQTIDVWGAH
jgi:hypothetical protein